MSDGPFYEIAAEADRLIGTGVTIFQKFTCGKCGARQTMPDPNALYKLGRCDECQHITDLEAVGCGFMLLSSNDPVEHAKLVAEMAASIASSPPLNRPETT